MGRKRLVRRARVVGEKSAGRNRIKGPECKKDMAHLGQENRAMSPEISELSKQALSLPVDERAALANTLLDSLEATSHSSQEAWDEEVTRRMEDLKAGRAVSVPWEQLHRELLAMVNER